MLWSSLGIQRGILTLSHLSASSLTRLLLHCNGTTKGPDCGQLHCQGLGDMKTHVGRLEKERAAAAARKAAGAASPAVESRLPSYMRQTAASAAMQKARHAGVPMLDTGCQPCHVLAPHSALKGFCPCA